jgi:hypothetical protein
MWQEFWAKSGRRKKVGLVEGTLHQGCAKSNFKKREAGSGKAEEPKKSGRREAGKREVSQSAERGKREAGSQNWREMRECGSGKRDGTHPCTTS